MSRNDRPDLSLIDYHIGKHDAVDEDVDLIVIILLNIITLSLHNNDDDLTALLVIIARHGGFAVASLAVTPTVF